MPGLTLGGPCENVLVEAVPGGPLDVFDAVEAAEAGTRPDELWALTRELIRIHTPWELDRTRTAEPTDAGGCALGALTPTVRHEVAELPSGRPVLALGDAAATNDPIAGQGANNANRAAELCLRAVLERGELPLDRGWLTELAAEIWRDRAHHSVRFSNTLLAPPAHLPALLAAGNSHRDVADRIAHAIDDVADFGAFRYEPGEAAAYLAQVGAV